MIIGVIPDYTIVRKKGRNTIVRKKGRIMA